MAGSAALLVLTVSQAPSVAVGLGYVALFGIGSMFGMGALSAVIAVPLALSARWLTWANSGLQGAVGRDHDRDRRQDDRGDRVGRDRGSASGAPLIFSYRVSPQLTEREGFGVRLI